MLICAAVRVMVCGRVGRSWEMVMCAAVRVMVCGRVGEMEENVVACCS